MTMVRLSPNPNKISRRTRGVAAPVMRERSPATRVGLHVALPSTIG